MAITAYSNDNDILEIRANILKLGVDDWTSKHQEAFGLINRVLNKRWYEQAASEQGLDWREILFDPEKVNIEEVKRLSCYKTLELVYLYLMNDSPNPDGFERQVKIFRDLYNEEFQIIIGVGLSYDWDADQISDIEEKFIRFPRRLRRV